MQIDKIKYIYELSINGERGEKKAAANKLKVLLEKYNLTLEDITGEEKIKTHYVSFYESFEKSLFHQTAFKFGCESGRILTKGKRLYVECTPSQFIDIDRYWQAYKRDYKAQLKIFQSAFIQKNEIFPVTDDDESDDKPLSAKEKEDLFKLMSMMDSIDTTKVNLEIKKSN